MKIWCESDGRCQQALSTGDLREVGERSTIKWSQSSERVSTQKGQRGEVNSYVQTHIHFCCGFTEWLGANNHDRRDVGLSGQVPQKICRSVQGGTEIISLGIITQHVPRKRGRFASQW